MSADTASDDRDTEAFEDAEHAAGGFGADVIHRLAERIGANAGARAVFGEPVERGGRTVIPVATSMWGVGAGTGESEEDGSGAGGGGGATTRPIGYIELSDEGTVFVPLQRPWQDVKLLLGVALAIWLVSRALNRILRG